MRIAAGILMIIVGVASVAAGVAFLSVFGIGASVLSIIGLSIFSIIPGVVLVTGGGFCLRRRHWKLCFASALLLVVIMIFWDCTPFTPYLAWFYFVIPVGIPAIVFVWLRKREWPASQA